MFMNDSISFIITAVLLGVGLAMDAFSVSIANGLADTHMKRSRVLLIAGTFAFFQFVMPEIGWFCVHYLAEKFIAFQKFIPWIALILLGFIGGKMLKEGISDLRLQAKASEGQCEKSPSEKLCSDSQGSAAELCSSDQNNGATFSFGMLIVQGIATSIDALSVGFTIADYTAFDAFVASLIIAIVTLIICLFGIKIGKLAGEKLSSKATILGGIILIAIGIEVFVCYFS